VQSLILPTISLPKEGIITTNQAIYENGVLRPLKPHSCIQDGKFENI